MRNFLTCCRERGSAFSLELKKKKHPPKSSFNPFPFGSGSRLLPPPTPSLILPSWLVVVFFFLSLQLFLWFFVWNLGSEIPVHLWTIGGHSLARRHLHLQVSSAILAWPHSVGTWWSTCLTLFFISKLFQWHFEITRLLGGSNSLRRTYRHEDATFQRCMDPMRQWQLRVFPTHRQHFWLSDSSSAFSLRLCLYLYQPLLALVFFFFVVPILQLASLIPCWFFRASNGLCCSHVVSALITRSYRSQ